MTKILHIDSDQTFRGSIVRALTKAKLHVFEMSDYTSVLSEFKNLSPSMVLIDLEIPSVIEIIKNLKKMNPGTPILALAQSQNISFVVQAILSGASDFIPKGLDFNLIIKKIQLAVHHASKSPLTFRETEILGWISRGLDNSKIADQLCITKDTVHSHVSKILMKLDVKSRAHAVAVAIGRGFLKI